MRSCYGGARLRVFISEGFATAPGEVELPGTLSVLPAMQSHRNWGAKKTRKMRKKGRKEGPAGGNG